MSICRHNSSTWSGIYVVGSVRVTPYPRAHISTRSIYATDSAAARMVRVCNIALKIRVRFATTQLDGVATDSWGIFSGVSGVIGSPYTAERNCASERRSVGIVARFIDRMVIYRAGHL